MWNGIEDQSQSVQCQRIVCITRATLAHPATFEGYRTERWLPCSHDHIAPSMIILAYSGTVRLRGSPGVHSETPLDYIPSSRAQRSPSATGHNPTNFLLWVLSQFRDCLPASIIGSCLSTFHICEIEARPSMTVVQSGPRHRELCIPALKNGRPCTPLWPL